MGFCLLWCRFKRLKAKIHCNFGWLSTHIFFSEEDSFFSVPAWRKNLFDSETGTAVLLLWIICVFVFVAARDNKGEDQLNWQCGTVHSYQLPPFLAPSGLSFHWLWFALRQIFCLLKAANRLLATSCRVGHCQGFMCFLNIYLAESFIFFIES